MKLTKLKNLVSYFGPYPYNPTLIFLFFGSLYFSRYVPIVLKEPAGIHRTFAALFMIILASLTSLVFVACVFFFKKYRPWSADNLLGYIFEIASAQFLLIFLSPLIQKAIEKLFDYDFLILLTLTPGLFIGSIFIAMLSLALMHQSERVIQDRLLHAEELVKKIAEDRRKLVMSDEEMRKQTSQFLHDRIQSDLMVIGLSLKSVIGKSSDEVSEAVEQVARQLERIRTLDIRNLVQILTPNLDAGGLNEALEVLCSQYQKNMDITVNIDDEIENSNANILLGIYRIVEQSLLNSLIHGPAESVFISITFHKGNEIYLDINDNGPGEDLDGIKLGVGSAIIDSWVNILRGRKEIITAPGKGYKLEITFPA